MDATVNASTPKSPQTALRVAISDQKLEAASTLISGGASLKAVSLSEERRHALEGALSRRYDDSNNNNTGGEDGEVLCDAAARGGIQRTRLCQYRSAMLRRQNRGRVDRWTDAA